MSRIRQPGLDSVLPFGAEPTAGNAAWLLVACFVVLLSPGHAQRHKRELDLEGFGMNLIKPPEVNTMIGGEPAAFNEFPFFVKFEGDGAVLCGGTLISPNRVLTAGHCIQHQLGWPKTVRVGPTTEDDGQVIPVQCGVTHPDYFQPPYTVFNDVAILKLSVNTTHVTPVTLNRNSSFPTIIGHNLTAMGFGATGGYDNFTGIQTLQKVGTHFVPIDDCINTYSKSIISPDVHLCADVNNKGDCNGDSGGPLLDTETGVQVGIISFGYGGCASFEYQDVYTNVAQYYDWIQSQINDDKCPETGGGVGGGGGGLLRTIGHVAAATVLRIRGFVSNVFNGFEDR